MRTTPSAIAAYKRAGADPAEHCGQLVVIRHDDDDEQQADSPAMTADVRGGTCGSVSDLIPPSTVRTMAARRRARKLVGRPGVSSRTGRSACCSRRDAIAVHLPFLYNMIPIWVPQSETNRVENPQFIGPATIIIGPLKDLMVESSAAVEASGPSWSPEPNERASRRNRAGWHFRSGAPGWSGRASTRLSTLE